MLCFSGSYFTHARFENWASDALLWLFKSIVVVYSCLIPPHFELENDSVIVDDIFGFEINIDERDSNFLCPDFLSLFAWLLVVFGRSEVSIVNVGFIEYSPDALFRFRC